MNLSKFETACERCKTKKADSFSFFREEGPEMHGHWKFCCDCARDEEDYHILFTDFFVDDYAVVSSLAHMHEKKWMDWGDFMDMMTRLRAAICHH